MAVRTSPSSCLSAVSERWRETKLAAVIAIVMDPTQRTTSSHRGRLLVVSAAARLSLATLLAVATSPSAAAVALRRRAAWPGPLQAGRRTYAGLAGAGGTAAAAAAAARENFAR